MTDGMCHTQADRLEQEEPKELPVIIRKRRGTQRRESDCPKECGRIALVAAETDDQARGDKCERRDGHHESINGPPNKIKHGGKCRLTWGEGLKKARPGWNEQSGGDFKIRRFLMKRNQNEMWGCRRHEMPVCSTKRQNGEKRENRKRKRGCGPSSS